MISNYGELQCAVKHWAKRRDIDDVIPDFINAAHIQLVEYVGPLTPLVEATDTNALLTYDPYTYLFGALAEAAVYLRDDGPLLAYADKFAAKLANLSLSGLDLIDGSPQAVIPQRWRWGWRG